MKSRSKRKQLLIKKLIENIIFLLNFAGFIFILGTIGALENFQEVSVMQWFAVILIMIIFYLETKLLEKKEA